METFNSRTVFFPNSSHKCRLEFRHVLPCWSLSCPGNKEYFLLPKPLARDDLRKAGAIQGGTKAESDWRFLIIFGRLPTSNPSENFALPVMQNLIWCLQSIWQFVKQKLTRNPLKSILSFLLLLFCLDLFLLSLIYFFVKDNYFMVSLSFSSWTTNTTTKQWLVSAILHFLLGPHLP